MSQGRAHSTQAPSAEAEVADASNQQSALPAMRARMAAVIRDQSTARYRAPRGSV